VRNNNEEPRSVSSDEWFLGKYSPFSCKIFPRNIFIAFYGNFRPYFRHISLGNIFPRNLSFGNNNKMSRNEALQLCFQRKYYWVPAVLSELITQICHTFLIYWRPLISKNGTEQGGLRPTTSSGGSGGGQCLVILQANKD
jgi:hypothetical protein